MNPRASLSALATVGRALKNVVRGDAWINEITGLGLPDFDRSKGMRFANEASLSVDMLTSLYRSDDIVRKIVGYFPEESLRRGLDFEGPNSKGLEASFKRYGLVDKIVAAAIWGRLYGGACLAIEADGPTTQPLRYRKGMPVYGFRVFDRSELQGQPFYLANKPSSRSHPDYYRVSPVNETSFYMHRSRAIWFGGIRTDRRTKEGELNGWDDSCLQPVINALMSFNGVDGSIDNMVSDASQGVFKMRGLLNLLAADPDQAEERARFLDLTRSICKAIFLDADSDESFEKIATSFAGLPEVWDRRAQRVASAAGFPVTVLFGISPAGLNATGASDLENFDNRTLAYRQTEIEPAIHLLNWLLTTDNETKAILPPLKLPTEKEEAEIAKLRADACKVRADTFAVYVTNEIMLPEQAAMQLYREGAIKIDPKLLEPARYVPEPSALPPQPTGGAEGAPRVELTPSDVATIITVNQALASLGLAPKDVDGELTIAEYQAKHSAPIVAAAQAAEGIAPGPVAPKPPVLP